MRAGYGMSVSGSDVEEIFVTDEILKRKNQMANWFDPLHILGSANWKYLHRQTEVLETVKYICQV